MDAELFQLKSPQKLKSGTSDPHDTKLLFLNTPGKSTTTEEHALKILSELEDPPENSEG